MTDPSQWGFETTQIHAGQVPEDISVQVLEVGEVARRFAREKVA